MMPKPIRRQYDLATWLNTNTGAKHLVSRRVGQRLREHLEDAFTREPPETVITLDCTGVEILDVTGADECLAKLAGRLIHQEYGDRMLVLRGVVGRHAGTIQVVLERKRLAMVTDDPPEGPTILGDLNPYLREAWAALRMSTHPMSAKDLSYLSGAAMTDSATKLLTLCKLHLVRRMRVVLPRGGREFHYVLVGGDRSC